jgi:hypothetical protein
MRELTAGSMREEEEGGRGREGKGRREGRRER